MENTSQYPLRVTQKTALKSFLSVFICIFLIIMAPSCSRARKAPEFPIENCHKVELIDSQSAKPIIGAEDLAFDRQHNRLFISAYDRRAVEKAARKRSRKNIPDGGVYAIDIAQLINKSPPSHKLTSLISAQTVSGGLHPHGITYSAQHQTLSFINRRYLRKNKKWAMSPKLEHITIDQPNITDTPQTIACAANNLINLDNKFLISYDHQSCNWRAYIENIFNQKKSGLIYNDSDKPFFDDISFANGVVRLADKKIALAATREKSLYIFSKDQAQDYTQIKLPEGPDNLTIGKNNTIIAATHPSLLRMGLHRKFGLGNSPSKIIRINPATKKIQTLFEDLTGKTFSAATVAIENNKHLIIGSVTQPGLLICEKPAHGE